MSLTPRQSARLHYGLVGVWAVLTVVALVTGLKDSIPWLVFVSHYANVAAHWSSARADMAGRKADPEDPL